MPVVSGELPHMHIEREALRMTPSVAGVALSISLRTLSAPSKLNLKLRQGITLPLAIWEEGCRRRGPLTL